ERGAEQRRANRGQRERQDFRLRQRNRRAQQRGEVEGIRARRDAGWRPTDQEVVATRHSATANGVDRLEDDVHEATEQVELELDGAGVGQRVRHALNTVPGDVKHAVDEVFPVRNLATVGFAVVEVVEAVPRGLDTLHDRLRVTRGGSKARLRGRTNRHIAVRVDDQVVG